MIFVRGDTHGEDGQFTEQTFHDGVEKNYPDRKQSCIDNCHSDPADPAAFILCKDELILNPKIVAVE